MGIIAPAQEETRTRRVGLGDLRKRARYARYLQIARRNEGRWLHTSELAIEFAAELEVESMSTTSRERPLKSLGEVLAIYEELNEAGKLHFLSPEDSRAELDTTIANARTFETKFRGKFRTILSL